MRKRKLLRWTGASVGGLAAPVLAGCPGDGESNDPERSTNAENRTDAADEGRSVGGTEAVSWSHEVRGRIETVADGLVLGVEFSSGDEDGDGGIFALEADSGEHRWTAGRSSRTLYYTAFAVADAIYVGWGNDVVGRGPGRLYAFEFDGSERWTLDTGGLYHQPKVADGRVYVVDNDDVVRAIRTADGEPLWETDLTGLADIENMVPVVAGVGDAVYVAAGPLLALDPNTGDFRWQYGEADDGIKNATIVDGAAYATDSEGVVAVANGEMSWRTTFEGASWQWSIRTVTNYRVIAADGHGVYALDAESGNEEWVLGDDGPIPTAVCGETVYASVDSNRDGDATGTIRAHDLDDGTVRWREPLEDGSVQSIQIVPETAGELVFVRTDNRLYVLTADGEVTRSAPLPDDIRSIIPDTAYRAMVGTKNAIYAVDIE